MVSEWAGTPPSFPAEGYPAHCCVVCKSAAPKWTLVRIGDVATAWACSGHIDAILDMMQRREFGSTEVSVKRFNPRVSNPDRTVL